MQIKQLMKENPVCVLPTDSLEQAAIRMKESNAGILPVVESATKTPIAVITDRDIVLRCIAEGRDPGVMTVREACSPTAICCDDDCAAEDAFHTMRDHQIGRLVVIDEMGHVSGIISLADLIARVPREIFLQLPGAAKPIPRQAA